MEKQRLKIKEIFFSLQGEGFHAGRATAFVRLSGCNLSCTFCDTDFTHGNWMENDEIVTQLLGQPIRFVVLTGGEPTLQAHALEKLVEKLHLHHFYVAMETNGTSLQHCGVDWITVSPKLSQGGAWVLKKGNELKVAYEGQNLADYEDSEFAHYFLQPIERRSASFGAGQRLEEETRREWKKTVDAILTHPKWRLSFQLHKELGLR